MAKFRITPRFAHLRAVITSGRANYSGTTRTVQNRNRGVRCDIPTLVGGRNMPTAGIERNGRSETQKAPNCCGFRVCTHSSLSGKTA